VIEVVVAVLFILVASESIESTIIWIIFIFWSSLLQIQILESGPQAKHRITVPVYDIYPWNFSIAGGMQSLKLCNYPAMEKIPGKYHPRGEKPDPLGMSLTGGDL